MPYAENTKNIQSTSSVVALAGGHMESMDFLADADADADAFLVKKCSVWLATVLVYVHSKTRRVRCLLGAGLDWTGLLIVKSRKLMRLYQPLGC